MAVITDIVAYWKLEESSGSRFDAHGSNTLTSVNSVASAAGKIGTGADLEASSSMRLTRAAQTWGVANAWSWSFWFNPESFTGNPRIIFIGPDGSTNNTVIGVNTSGFLFINMYNSSGSVMKEYTATTTAMSNGNWYHIAVTWDGTNLLAYVNNTSQSFTKTTDNSGSQTDTSRGLVIGSTAAGTAPTDGILDEIGWWAKALTSGEVGELYNSGSGYQYPFDRALDQNIVSYWKMDETSGTRDDAVSTNDLSDNNTVGNLTGIINLGADFERSASEYLNIADASQSGLDFTGGDFSFSFWIKLESDPGSSTEYAIIDKENSSGSNRQYRISYLNDGTRKMLVGVGVSGGTNMGFFTVNRTLSVATWYHMVVTYRKATNIATIYENGTLLGSGTLDATGALDNGNGNFNIGAKFNSAADFFDGVIDEVGAWARVLDLNEAIDLYNGGSGLAYPFGGTAYTIVAALGTFTLSGIAAALTAAWKIIAALGTYTYTGIAALFSLGKGISANVGTYALTGIASLFNVTLSMAAALGTYTLTGIDVVLKTGKMLTAEVGNYVLTGIAAVIGLSTTIVAALGTYTYTGYSATVGLALTLIAQAGSYILTGFNARFPILWRNVAKNLESFVNRVKNTVSWNNQDRSNI